MPPDLRDAALSRLRHANAIFGALRLDGILDVDPVWRPLIAALCPRLAMSWITRGDLERGWFPGSIELMPAATPVLGALRGSSGRGGRGAAMGEGLARERDCRRVRSRHRHDGGGRLRRIPSCAGARGGPSDLLHHGLPALDSGDGRACAALADALLRGPTQERMRRLLRLVSVDGVPTDWSRGLPRGALLAESERWRRALTEAGAAISWGPVAHLASAPRAHVRLLGMTVRDWPRSASEDPLAPDGDDGSSLEQVGRDLLHYAVAAGAASIQSLVACCWPMYLTALDFVRRRCRRTKQNFMTLTGTNEAAKVSSPLSSSRRLVGFCFCCWRAASRSGKQPST